MRYTKAIFLNLLLGMKYYEEFPESGCSNTVLLYYRIKGTIFDWSFECQLGASILYQAQC